MLQRCLILADCHARPELITNALNHARYDPDKDRFLFAGDLLDIGFHPEECWTLLRRNKAEFLWGNHEMAVHLGKHIGPQDYYSFEFYKKMEKDARKESIKFSVAAVHDNVLITHAGLSSQFCDRIMDVEKITNVINKTSFERLWLGDSPLWYRPSAQSIHKGIVQVCGHTPPDYVFRNGPIKDLYVVDPYTKNGFDDKGRFRYATIEDGQVKIEDSNE